MDLSLLVIPAINQTFSLIHRRLRYLYVISLGHWHLCYLPLVGIGKFEDRLTLLGPKSKTRFLFQIRSEAIGKIEKDDTLVLGYQFMLRHTSTSVQL